MRFRNALCHICCHLRECGRGEGANQYCNRGQRKDRLDENAREREGGRGRETPFTTKCLTRILDKMFDEILEFHLGAVTKTLEHPYDVLE